MTLRRINARDEREFAAWFDVFSRSELDRSDATNEGWHPDELRARAVNEDAPKIDHLLSYEIEPGVPVAVACMEITRDDNLHSVRTYFHVDPRLRRRGFGTAALARVEQYGRDLGRGRLVIGVIEGPQEVGTSPSRYFAPIRGYTVADEGARRELDWPRPDGELDRLDEEWMAFADGYEIVSWVGPTPSQWRAGRARLSSVMPAEAPYANLDVEEELWDEQRVLVHENTVNEMGRELFVAVALHRASNELVGYTELTVSREYMNNAYQWDTLVVGAHRGHRLGGLLKIATMRLLAKSGLAVQRISTFNSLMNIPMIRVNEALGARLAGGHVDWRKDL